MVKPREIVALAVAAVLLLLALHIADVASRLARLELRMSAMDGLSR